MTTAVWVIALLLGWFVLACIVGLLTARWISGARPTHRATRTSRARSRIQFWRKHR